MDMILGFISTHPKKAVVTACIFLMILWFYVELRRAPFGPSDQDDKNS